MNTEEPKAKGYNFYPIYLGFTLGILWRSFHTVSLQTIILFGAAYLLAITYRHLHLKRSSAGFSLFILAFILGIVRFQISDTTPPPLFNAMIGQKTFLSGVIEDEPENGPAGMKLLVRTRDQEQEAKVVIFTRSGNKYKFGDLIAIKGRLDKPENFTTDQGLEFDYINYLRKDGIFYTMRNPELTFVSSGHGNFIKSWLFNLKEASTVAIAKVIPVPESTMLDGIILGERYAFSNSFKQLFMDTGTIHIVTIGGYHVTLVAEWIMEIFSFLPKYFATWMGILSIFLYIIATGAAQTSIRAGIMATIALIANVTGRMYEASHTLIVAAVIMIFINPFVLAYDISFELSFLATVAIIFLTPRIVPYTQWIRWEWLREIIAVTFSMYIFVTPFVLYKIGSVSIVALPANILIVPLLPITMIAGFTTGITGLISSSLAFIPGNIAYVLLSYQIRVIRILAGLPFASIVIPNFPLLFVVLFYLISFWFFSIGKRPPLSKQA
ncbi:MAG: ComEC family competence protein [Candidatus Vogelbacteria bacterium]|nr:ComEC family competence protein [Candidatus Vogelbacteria bacterium]